MLIIKSLEQLGRYTLFMKRSFGLPDKWSVFGKRTVQEIVKLGVDSIPLVIVISLFIGAVITIQMQLNISSPLIPAYSVGLATRDIVLLEFSNSILCLILAGKVGSNIASEIGTMRVTEQIDALEIMGVNSAAYLILPKIIATMIFFPFLAAFSMIVGMFGGFLVARMGVMIPNDYIDGLLYYFDSYEITYSLVKMTVFAFLITSISGYYGYYTKGNSLEVGKASTTAVVVSSIMIMIFNLLLTQLMR